MPSIEGKKYFVVPSETYVMIVERQSSAMERTEKKELYKSDQEMEDIRDKELSSDQKVQYIQRNMEIGECGGIDIKK